MVVATSSSTTSTVSYDLILSTGPPTTTVVGEIPAMLPSSDLTTYILFICPFYTSGLLFNFLSIYSILVARVYRQYLSNVLLAVICIGALLNGQGQMFLILLRWANNPDPGQLCSSSIYSRDAGYILMHTHILFLAFERVLANLKKHPNNLHRQLIQRAHLFLIAMSFISIILAFTVPIVAFRRSFAIPFGGSCLPSDVPTYTAYLRWIYFGFGHPFLWSACLLLGVFLLRTTTISYSTLVPMNRIALVVSLCSGIDLVTRTLFDDIIGVNNEPALDNDKTPTKTIVYLKNLRDSVSLINDLLIGLLFFLFRPEIRLWFRESMQRFQAAKKEVVSPQMLEIRSELDDRFPETDDGDLDFRTDN